jgi:hypothetical protein
MLKKEARRRGKRRKPGRRGGGGAGVYPALKRLGIIAGASPALSEKAVLGVLSNTFDEAEAALRRDGVAISAKRLRTISMKFSQAALAERQRRTASFLSGDGVKADVQMSGRRLAITIDGGRIRTRIAKGGRRKNGAARAGFFTDWKEPKVFSIYELDDQGHKKKKGFISCDGTIDGPEGMMAILATELAAHRVAEAAAVTVLADGAPWIWNRLDELLASAGISPDKVTKILDFYHAAEHLKAIAEILYRSPAKQTQWFNRMRQILKTRPPKIFMAALIEAIGAKSNADLCRELDYFQTNSGAINYRRFKKLKLPIGSGVIESTIRRVVNLRLKGAGMFWLKENAEGLLHLRCQLKSGNWDAFYANLIENLSQRE